MDKKFISIIIPFYNGLEDISKCVESVLNSTYSFIEIIIIDNASEDSVANSLQNEFGRYNNFRLIKNSANLGAAAGRNIGAKYAKGEYLLFVDSDNVIDKNMVGILYEFLETNKNYIMAGPLMLYKNNPSLVWLYYADINMYTSQAKYKGTGEEDRGQYGEIVDVGHIPNCFMVKKNDFESAGGFDEKYFIMYEEADFSEKIKKISKKKIAIFTKAITYHSAFLPKKHNRDLFKNDKRAFLTARNRIYFMKKNANFFQLIVFLLIFFPLSFFYYQIYLLANSNFRMAYYYFKGSLDGLFL